MKSGAKSELKKLALEMLLVVVVASVLGGSVHFSLVRRFLGGEFRQSFLDLKKYAGLRFIALDEAQDLFETREAIFIDSRSRQDFATGHVPGALNIPFDEMKEEEVKQGEEASKKSLSQILLSFPPESVLVVYCEGGDCQTSLALARLIHDLGFKDIRVFEGGWAEWSALGLSEEKSR